MVTTVGLRFDSLATISEDWKGAAKKAPRVYAAGISTSAVEWDFHA